jgi:hypothetical protein
MLIESLVMQNIYCYLVMSFAHLVIFGLLLSFTANQHYKNNSILRTIYAGKLPKTLTNQTFDLTALPSDGLLVSTK